MINDESDINIIKSEVKFFLTKHFNEKTQFCPFEQANESLFVFSSSICINDVVKRLRFLDTTKNVAVKLRKSLLEIDLDLHDKFCDGEDLFGSWDNLPLSDEIFTFLGTLFNTNPVKLLPKYLSNCFLKKFHPITLHRCLIVVIVMMKVTVTIVTLFFQMMKKVMY